MTILKTALASARKKMLQAAKAAGGKEPKFSVDSMDVDIDERKIQISIENIVGTCDLGFPINIHHIPCNVYHHDRTCVSQDI